jgi:Flp pilus assembly protein TadG
MILGHRIQTLGCRLRRLLRDKGGTATIEFALVLPLILTLYIGGVELSQAINAKRKVVLVTRAVADLVSQPSSITNADMTNILNASAAVGAPIPAAQLKVRVASVTFDANKKLSILWSENLNWTAPTQAEITGIPDNLKVDGTSLIWAQSQYAYTPTIGYAISGTVLLSEKLYMRPRVAATVARLP